MKKLPINIVIDSKFHIKDPQSSELGKKVVGTSIKMINELGFECFTFKKLGEVIGSNESSIYRYFSNKHMLLVYLFNWYWTWIEYKIVFTTSNISSPKEKLNLMVSLLTEETKDDNENLYINESLLNKLIITQSSKVYNTKDVDLENKKGFYESYKRVVQRVSDIVLEINPDFAYPHMLISTVIEGSHCQRYFAEHLPSLTDVQKSKDVIIEFYIKLVQKTIKS